MGIMHVTQVSFHILKRIYVIVSIIWRIWLFFATQYDPSVRPSERGG